MHSNGFSTACTMVSNTFSFQRKLLNWEYWYGILPVHVLCSIFYVKCNITILLFIFQLISLELIYLKTLKLTALTWITYTDSFKYLFYKIFLNNITLKTCQRFFTSVSPQMHFKCASVDKMIVTMDAIKWLFFGMIHSIKCIYIIIEITLYLYI